MASIKKQRDGVNRMTQHPGFTLNSIKDPAARLNALRQKRDHIQNQIEELYDKLEIIDGEIVEIGGLLL